MEIHSLQADSTYSSPTFEQRHFDNSDHQPSPSNVLPDFKVSNVIAKNEPIQIYEGGHKPLDNFFNRMDQLGYQANNVSQTFVMETQTFVEQTLSKRKSEQQPKYPQNNDNFLNNQSNPALESKFTIDQRVKSKVKKRFDKLDVLISNLNFEKFNILDSLRMYQEQQAIVMRETSQRIQEKIEEVTSVHICKIKELEGQLQIYMTKCRELQDLRHIDQAQSGHLSKDLQQMQETNKHLNSQLDQVQVENNELKYQLHHSQINQKTVQKLQEQIASLNKTIDENCEYIFDLQQKVAGANLQLQAQEENLRKRYEMMAEQQRLKMQNEYKAQFQKVQEDLQKRIEEELEEEYHDSLKKIQNNQKEKIEQIKLEYEQQIKKLEREKIELVKINREYQSKIHQNQQYRLKKHQAEATPLKEIDFSRELENSRMTNQSLERQIKEKDEELNYYKDMAVKPYAKNSNILVIDHNGSMQKEAISPSSSLAALYHHHPGYTPSSKDDRINTILSRIRLRQNGSILSNLHDMSMSRQYPKGLNQSNFRPVSPESVILQKQKDMRMRNISHKLQQLRADIRKEIGMIHH